MSGQNLSQNCNNCAQQSKKENKNLYRHEHLTSSSGRSMQRNQSNRKTKQKYPVHKSNISFQLFSFCEADVYNRWSLGNVGIQEHSHLPARVYLPTIFQLNKKRWNRDVQEACKQWYDTTLKSESTYRPNKSKEQVSWKLFPHSPCSEATWLSQTAF